MRDGVRKCVASALVAAGVLALSASSQGQTVSPQLKKRLQQSLDAFNKIPASRQKYLSGATLSMLQIAERVNRPAGSGGDDGGTFVGRNAKVKGGQEAPHFGQLAGVPLVPGGPIPVSNPNLDFTVTVLDGFTQNETHTAQCGNTVVVGYNDSGSFEESTSSNFFGAASLNGFSVSTNGGNLFRDLGFLNPGLTPANFLIGDPVLACTSPTTFYYASLFLTATPPDPNTGIANPLSAVTVSKSVDSGVLWADPVVVVAKDGHLHMLDKEWMAADPNDPQRLYVTYTDFDSSFLFNPRPGACNNQFRQAIEFVTSQDGGSTWTTPAVLTELCGVSLQSLTGSQVLVSPEGKVYVAYMLFGPQGLTRSLQFQSSSDHGATFSAPVKMTDVVPTGDGAILQGGFRNNEFPSLAVDRSSGPSRGTIYVTWADGRNNMVPDVAHEGFMDTYNYPDAMMSKSHDQGRTWSSPVTISPQPASFKGVGRDQFLPAVAVDKDGEVAVCYYDRRADPKNNLIDRFCSTSNNGGTTWTESRKTPRSWAPVIAADRVFLFDYMGDYDGVTSDFLLANDGFVGAYQIMTDGNPDVFAAKF